MFNFLRNIGPAEIAILVLILVLLFGTKIVTKLARTSGESLKEIKKVKKSFNEALEDDPKSESEAS